MNSAASRSVVDALRAARPRGTCRVGETTASMTLIDFLPYWCSFSALQGGEGWDEVGGRTSRRAPWNPPPHLASPPPRAEREWLSKSLLHQLPHRVRCDRQGDLAAVGRAARERLGKMQRLLGLDLGRHRRLVLIDDAFDHHRPGRVQGLVEDAAAFLRPLDGEAAGAAGAREGGEVDGVQVADIFGIAEEDHLLPFDLAEAVVLDQ